MEAYKELPLWKAAYALGRDVDTLTKDFPPYNTIIRFLREKTATLPVTIAAHTASAEAADVCADALKRAYEQAHDAEYVLFFALLFRYLPYEDACGLFNKLYNVKRLIVAEFKGAYGSDQAAPVH